MNKGKLRARRSLKTKAIQAKSLLPRLVVFRSGKHIYAQIIEKSVGGDKVLVSSSTLVKALNANGTKVEQATAVGSSLAEQAIKLKISKVSFDRNGYKYHGRVKALANGAREAGLKF